ncbi:hypothetical protein EW146_g8656, partial [Bondarzewia mesenterica]
MSVHSTASVSSAPAAIFSNRLSTTFDDFKFDVIGKDPVLLGRMSASGPDADYRSPSPDPSWQGTSQSSRPLSRPTLLQSLANTDHVAAAPAFKPVTSPAPHATDGAPVLAASNASTLLTGFTSSNPTPPQHPISSIPAPFSRASREPALRQPDEAGPTFTNDVTSYGSTAATNNEAAPTCEDNAASASALPSEAPAAGGSSLSGAAGASTSHSVPTSRAASVSSSLSLPNSVGSSSSEPVDRLRKNFIQRRDGIPKIQRRFDDRATELFALTTKTFESFKMAEDQISAVQKEVDMTRAQANKLSMQAHLAKSQADRMLLEATKTHDQANRMSDAATKLTEDVRQAKADFTSAIEKSDQISRFVPRIVTWLGELCTREASFLDLIQTEWAQHLETKKKLAEAQALLAEEERRKAEEELQRIAEEKRHAEEAAQVAQQTAERLRAEELARKEQEVQREEAAALEAARQREAEYVSLRAAFLEEKERRREEDAAKLRAEREEKDGRQDREREQELRSELEKKKARAESPTTDDDRISQPKEKGNPPSNPPHSGKAKMPLSQVPPNIPSVPQSRSSVDASRTSLPPQPASFSLSNPPVVTTQRLSVDSSSARLPKNASKMSVVSGFVPAQTEVGRQVIIDGPYGSTTLRSEQQALKAVRRADSKPGAATHSPSNSTDDLSAQVTKKPTVIPPQTYSHPIQPSSSSTANSRSQQATQKNAVVKTEPSPEPPLIVTSVGPPPPHPEYVLLPTASTLPSAPPIVSPSAPVETAPARPSQRVKRTSQEKAPASNQLT